MRFIGLICLALSIVVGSSSVPAHSESVVPLVLEKFFSGKLEAEGHFTNSFTGARRDLKVQMLGRWNGATLILKEDFVYSDGESDQKTWYFTKLNGNSYTGVREDVIGEADISAVGGDIFLTYKAKVGGFDLNFKDRLTRVDAETVHNTADVLFLNFIKVGEVDLTIRRKKR
jgi:hypothetical protein